MRVLLIGAAGAAGALSRYGVGLAVGPQRFPWATLLVNVLGSFLLGFVLAWAVGRGWTEDVTRSVTIGFIGSFTTFSTFVVDTTSLTRADRLPGAVLYVLASIALGIAASEAGLATATRLWS